MIGSEKLKNLWRYFLIPKYLIEKYWMEKTEIIAKAIVVF